MTTISCLLLKFWWNNMVSGDSVETQIISSQNNSTPINFFSFCFGKAKKKKKTIETNKKNFQLPVVTCRLLLYQTEEDLSIPTIYRYSNNSSFWSSTQSHEKKSYHYHYDNPCVIETILCFWATHLSHDHQHRKDCFFCFCFEFGWYLCFFACK